MSTAAKALLFGAVIGFLGIAASLLPAALDFETHLGLKLLFWFRGPRPAPPQIVIVTVERESADHLQLRHEPALWPRDLHAEAIQALSARGARVIVVDIAFEKPQSPEQDAILAQALREAGNVVLFQRLEQDRRSREDLRAQFGVEIHIEQRMPLLPQLTRAAWGVAPFPLPKVPVRVDQCWLFKGSAGDIPTLPVVAFQAYAMTYHKDLLRVLHEARAGEDEPPAEMIAAIARNHNASKVARHLRYLLRTHEGFAERLLERLEDEARFTSPEAQRVLTSLFRLYLAEDGHYLDFYGPPQSILTVPYHHLLDPALMAHDDAAGTRFSDKVVFVGFADQLQPEQRDGFHTVFSRADGVDVSGVEIAGTAFANILEGRSIRPLIRSESILLLGIAGFIIGALLLALPASLAPFAAIGFALAYVSVAYRAFLVDGLWLPLTTPVLIQIPLALVGAVLWRHAHAQQQHEQTQTTFAFYVPQHVIDTLPCDQAKLDNFRRFVYGVCLATDAVQYTRLSESLSPDQLRTSLNRYYQMLFEPVKRHGGLISDVIGDAMLAVWSGPIPDKKLHRSACSAALDICDRLDHLQLRPGQKALLPTRFGLHAGDMVLGNVGAGDHYEYRAVGDAVNTAHRLEQLNKVLSTRILTSAELIRDLDDVVVRALGSFQLPGKQRPVLVYELVGFADAIAPETPYLHYRFNEALQAFRERRFTEAQTLLERLLVLYPHDGPSWFYMKLCKRFQRRPPPLGWDGNITTHGRAFEPHRETQR